MGLTKRYLEEREENEEIESFLRQLIEEEGLSGAALGIAKQATTQGIESLSVRQREVVDSIFAEYPKPVCPRCGDDIPLGELETLSLRDGYCSRCDHQMAKIDKE